MNSIQYNLYHFFIYPGHAVFDGRRGGFLKEEIHLALEFINEYEENLSDKNRSRIEIHELLEKRWKEARANG